MSKKPTIKQKLSKPRSKRRFAVWVHKIQERLIKRINLVKCDKCGSPRLSHTPCRTCGYYRGRQIIKMKEPELKKTTKVKV
ncbi:MAG: 50S ribosomal protein L32 [Patescibacteria group bacterium]|nr:50S ribosomal protein L32 [Patescibacteria group bacterium]